MTPDNRHFVEQREKMGLCPEVKYNTKENEFYWISKLNEKIGNALYPIIGKGITADDALDLYRYNLQGKQVVADTGKTQINYIVI